MSTGWRKKVVTLREYRFDSLSIALKQTLKGFKERDRSGLGKQREVVLQTFK
ncbi:hypothetical protein D3C75_1296480 [compost metagenome]